MKLADLQPRVVRLSGKAGPLTEEQREANRRKTHRQWYLRNGPDIRLKKRLRTMERQ